MNTSRRRNGRQPVAHLCKQTIVVEDLWDWVRFVGNFRDLRNVSHIRQEMQTMAFHIKEVLHDYAHKKTKAIVHADYATLQYHIDTLIRFRDGLGEVPEVKKASPTTVATKNGLAISVS